MEEAYLVPRNVSILKKHFDPLNMLVRFDDVVLLFIIYSICQCVKTHLHFFDKIRT